MEESYRKGLASHPDPESCMASREAAIEALTPAAVRASFYLLFLTRNAPSRPAGGSSMLLLFLHRKVLFWFWRGRRGEAPAGYGAEPRAQSRNH
jgi:hypothetical protein